MMLLGNINAIPFRRRFGGGGGTPFPNIPGMIARYSVLGLTNEQMAANPVWVDKTGNGHDIQLKNFSWKGMSGVGGYEFNFLSSDWFIPSDQTIERFSHKIVIISKQRSAQLQNTSRLKSIKITIKVTGLEANGSTLRIYDNIGNDKKQDYNKDGIYKIDYTANEGANIIYFYVFGGNMGQLENPITIEQLPLYPGALVFDGVDDYGVCDNFPILTKEKGYTVVALRQWLSRPTDSIYGLISNTKNWFTDGAFIFEYQNNSKRGTTTPISFGQTSVQVLQSGVLSYQTSLKYNEFSIVPGNFEASERLIVGSAQSARYFANAAIWEICILDHDATEEELTNIKDYFVKTYPWLFPDQAWTVTGKTNEDTDRATIANITGNGNNLVLSNFGFIEGSGYNEEGEYAGYLVTDGVDDQIISSSFEMGKGFTIVGDWEFLPINKLNYTGIHKGSNLVLYNDPIGVRLYLNQLSTSTHLDIKRLNAICSDGRVYDKNWNEIVVYTPEEGVIGTAKLMIGGNNNKSRFTTLIFKNLGIYNNQILSKDECIKAYNYLQTLKTK